MWQVPFSGGTMFTEPQQRPGGLFDWLNRAERGIRGVMGPAYEPARAAANLFNPMQDLALMQQGGREMMEGNPAGLANSATGFLSMFGPGDDALDLMKLAIFAGPGARTANKVALEAAQQMDKAGKSAKEIWDDTGWFKGADDKWRFEIDDSRATDDAVAALADVRENAAAAGKAYGDGGSREMVPFGGVLDHPELFKAYPEMADDVSVVFLPEERMGSAFGRYGANNMALNEKMIDDGMPQKSPILHETQHAVQDVEGFARGGSSREFELPGIHPDTVRDADILQMYLERNGGDMDAAKRRFEELFKVPPRKGAVVIADSVSRQDVMQAVNSANSYKRLAGEVEALNVQTRMNMTPDQRRASPPWETEDVARAQQIVRYR